MSFEFKAPFLPFHRIISIADEFIAKYNPSNKLPVPIDEIVELQLKLHITPLPQFEKRTGVVSALTSDLHEILIDDQLVSLKRKPYRYNYSLAHEVGHIFLHSDLFKKFNLKDTYDWKQFMMQVDMNEYSWLETHAYQFAGLVLVPRAQLGDEIAKIRTDFSQKDGSLSAENEIFSEYAIERLKVRFQVSDQVLEKRIKKEGFSIP